MSLKQVADIIRKQEGLLRSRYFQDPDEPMQGACCAIGALARALPPGWNRLRVLHTLASNNGTSIMGVGSRRILLKHYGISEQVLYHIQRRNDELQCDSVSRRDILAQSLEDEEGFLNALALEQEFTE